METQSFKALSIARLQGNIQGNIAEILPESDGNIVESIWCSVKINGSFPGDCIRINCEYHKEQPCNHA